MLVRTVAAALLCAAALAAAPLRVTISGTTYLTAGALVGVPATQLNVAFEISDGSARVEPPMDLPGFGLSVASGTAGLQEYGWGDSSLRVHHAVAGFLDPSAPGNDDRSSFALQSRPGSYNWLVLAETDAMYAGPLSAGQVQPGVYSTRRLRLFTEGVLEFEQGTITIERAGPVTATPEPASGLLLVAGLGGLALVRRIRR